MRGCNRPYCTDCIVPLTIEHIMVKFPSYGDQRDGYLGANVTLREALRDEDTARFGGPVYKFLVEINILNKI